MMTWTISTDLGEVSWVDGALFDDTPGADFTAWASTGPRVSVSPTGPEFTADLADELVTYWAVFAWAEREGLAAPVVGAISMDPAPWERGLPEGTVY